MRTKMWNGECGMRNVRKASRPLPVPHSPFPLARNGITLLEVLISMFVLLFGLMGVAAVFPVGNHYAGRGEQFDRSTALSESAFGELRARGVLRPETWLYGAATGDEVVGASDDDLDTLLTFSHPPLTPIVIQDHRVNSPGAARQAFNVLGYPTNPVGGAGTAGPGRAFVIDPLGVAAAYNATPVVPNADVFPIATFDEVDPQAKPNTAMPGPWALAIDAATPLVSYDFEARWPIRRVTLPVPPTGGSGFEFSPVPTQIAESIFQLRDDLAVELPAEADRPAIQRWRADQNGTPDNPADDIPLRRAYAGNYTWLATVVPTGPAGIEALQPSSPRHGHESYDVSVAVVHKRDLTPSPDSERAIAAQLFVGGELAFYAQGTSPDSKSAVDNALKDLRAGQWIALAGVNPANGQLLMKWYRLLSLDAEYETADVVPAPTLPIAGSTPSVYVRRAMVEGPDWPASTSTVSGVGYNGQSIEGLQAIIIPGVVDVTTQSLRIGQTPAEWGL